MKTDALLRLAQTLDAHKVPYSVPGDGVHPLVATGLFPVQPFELKPAFAKLFDISVDDLHMLFAFDAQAQQAARQYGLPHALTQDATPAMVAANIRAYVERNLSK